MKTVIGQGLGHGLGQTPPDRQQIWDWLHLVPDPEIPVISVVDLGIVRDIKLRTLDNKTSCIIVITPTYSGCPAMKVIAEGIVEVLHDHGIEHIEIETQLSPAWTTDWMSERGKNQLKNYGIAPPAQQVIDISGISRKQYLAPKVMCPHCQSMNTAVVSEFGSTACKSLYRCKDCLEPFDYFKSH